MTAAEAIKALNGLTGDDPEKDHVTADDILVAYLRGAGHFDVAQAYEEARARIEFWYA